MAKKKREDGKDGPYLAAAVFCEQVIQGNDGVLTPIRIIDQYHAPIPANAPEDFPSKEKRLLVPTVAFLSFKSGKSGGGEHTLRLVMESPSGDRANTKDQQIELTSPAHGGANLVLPFA